MTNTTGQRERLARELEGVLADSYALYNALQVCHWNVVGPRFASLHDLFEKQYRELAEAIDDIAERIRALGYYTRGTLGELLAMTRVTDERDLRGSSEMLKHLITAHQQVIHRVRKAQGVAEEAVDEASFDLLVERQRAHEKAAWMLRAQAGEESETLQALPRESSAA